MVHRPLLCRRDRFAERPAGLAPPARGRALTTGRRTLRRNHGRPQATLFQYALSPGFLEATAVNWQSEFLQMAAYVWLTVFLFQKGSAESKDPDKAAEEVDRYPDPMAGPRTCRFSNTCAC